MESDDPFFAAKAAQIIALYLQPPAHAAVFCVDEERHSSPRPAGPGAAAFAGARAERHGFAYYRHGALSLFAALEIKSGAVIGKTAPRHSSAEFVAFLGDLVAHQPAARRIHIIAF